MSKFQLNRRSLIKSGVALGAGLALPTIFTSSARAYLNEPTGDTVTLGFNVPQSGPYADEGADELRAFELAVEHLNGGGDGGMLNTFSSKVLDGTGILGKKVAFVTGDTQTKSDAARASAKSMIEKDGAIMISGGSSSGVAVAVQALCQEAGVIFMAGLTHANDTTGKDKKANGFRHFFNSYMSGAALAPILAKEYGNDRKAYHLTADYNWGYTTEQAVRESTEALGWETVNSVLTPLTQTDFSSYIAPVLNSGADVLVLNHYGGNMVNSLTNAVQFGLRQAEANGKKFEIVVPLYSELMARGAGKNIAGILGSQNWDWKLENELGARYSGTNAFVKSFGEKYGFPPSQAAHTCYVQTLLYADAVTSRQVVRPLRGGRSSRRLRVRRYGQRPDPLSWRRPPVLQGRGRGARQGEPGERVRSRRNRRGHPGRAGHLCA
jgi:branched-chain amino acid transport system substrate-binding protein